MSDAARTLEVAAEVAAVLSERGARCAVIGAVALAVHGYPRATADLDLATLVRTLRDLDAIAEALRARGYDVHVSPPDADDPLGGVLTVVATDADPVQIVNYFNPWSGWSVVGKEAIETAEPDVLLGLAVVDVPHLIALKLYAGGRKSALDVLELLSRHPPEVLDATRAVCDRLGLGAALTRVLAG
jgi:predicted nucleotidyltransferase